MKPLFATAILAISLSFSTTACSIRQAAPIAAQQQDAYVSPEDFQRVAGETWTGELTYLDYSSQTQASIPVAFNVSQPEGHTIHYTVRYPGETQYNSTEVFRISKAGDSLNGNPILSRTETQDGTLSITTFEQGTDDGRPADIKMIYALAADVLTITKMVKFEGTTDYIQRNQYRLTR